jgi:hypothetical protein
VGRIRGNAAREIVDGRGQVGGGATERRFDERVGVTVVDDQQSLAPARSEEEEGGGASSVRLCKTIAMLRAQGFRAPIVLARRSSRGVRDRVEVIRLSRT